MSGRLQSGGSKDPGAAALPLRWQQLRNPKLFEVRHFECSAPVVHGGASLACCVATPIIYLVCAAGLLLFALLSNDWTRLEFGKPSEAMMTHSSNFTGLVVGTSVHVGPLRVCIDGHCLSRRSPSADAAVSGRGPEEGGGAVAGVVVRFGKQCVTEEWAPEPRCSEAIIAVGHGASSCDRDAAAVRALASLAVALLAASGVAATAAAALSVWVLQHLARGRLAVHVRRLRRNAVRDGLLVLFEGGQPVLPAREVAQELVDFTRRDYASAGLTVLQFAHREQRWAMACLATTLLAAIFGATGGWLHFFVEDSFTHCGIAACEHYRSAYAVLWMPINAAAGVPLECHRGSVFVVLLAGLALLAASLLHWIAAIAALLCGRRAGQLREMQQRLELEALRVPHDVREAMSVRRIGDVASVNSHGDAEYNRSFAAPSALSNESATRFPWPLPASHLPPSPPDDRTLPVAAETATSDASAMAVVGATSFEDVLSDGAADVGDGARVVGARGGAFDRQPRCALDDDAAAAAAAQPIFSPHDAGAEYTEDDAAPMTIDGAQGRSRTLQHAAMADGGAGTALWSAMQWWELLRERIAVTAEREQLERHALVQGEMGARRARFEFPMDKLRKAMRLVELHQHVLETFFGPLHDVVVAEDYNRARISRRCAHARAHALRELVTACDARHAYSPVAVREALQQLDQQADAATLIHPLELLQSRRQLLLSAPWCGETHNVAAAVADLISAPPPSPSHLAAAAPMPPPPLPSSWSPHHVAARRELIPGADPTSFSLAPSPSSAVPPPTSRAPLAESSAQSRAAPAATRSPPPALPAVTQPSTTHRHHHVAARRATTTPSPSLPTSVVVSSESDEDPDGRQWPRQQPVWQPNELERKRGPVGPPSSRIDRATAMTLTATPITPPQPSQVATAREERLFGTSPAPIPWHQSPAARTPHTAAVTVATNDAPSSGRSLAFFDLLGDELRNGRRGASDRDDVALGFESLAMRTSTESLAGLLHGPATQWKTATATPPPPLLLDHATTATRSPRTEGPDGASPGSRDMTIHLPSSTAASDAAEAIERELLLLKVGARRGAVQVAEQAAFFPGSHFAAPDRSQLRRAAGADGSVRTPERTSPAHVDASWGSSAVARRLDALRQP